jgi:hypothetical protein
VCTEGHGLASIREQPLNHKPRSCFFVLFAEVWALDGLLKAAERHLNGQLLFSVKLLGLLHELAF